MPSSPGSCGIGPIYSISLRAHFLFAQFVRRPPVIGCQPANRFDVNLLAPGCQPRQVHVLDHPPSQRGHRHLPSFHDRPGPRPNLAKRYSQLFQSRFWPLTSEFPIESTSRIRDLRSKFPVKWNREIIVPEQGIKSADQGSFSPDQGRLSGSGQSARTGNGTSL